MAANKKPQFLQSLSKDCNGFLRLPDFSNKDPIFLMAFEVLFLRARGWPKARN